MKNLFIIFSILLSLNSFAQPGTYSGTFILDLTLYSSTVSNVDFVRGTQTNPMTSIGNNQYSYNFSSFLTSPTIYYKFKVDGVLEHFPLLDSCLFINPASGDTLRFINLNTTTPSIVCWESCSSCVSSILGCTDSTANNYNSVANVDDGSCEYNITFYVDMSESNLAFDTVEVFGTFNGWCGGCATMTDANNDSIWEITIPLISGSYEYKFATDNNVIEESLYEGDNCVVSAWGFTNRILNVNGNQSLDTVCWNRCYSCDTERNFYNVTFQLDMSNVISTYTYPEVNGTFNNWCGYCWQLNDLGNNIWSRSFNVDTSTHTFKFSADNWNIEENLDSALSCVSLGFDSTGALQYVNRELKLTSDTIIDVCWESCNPCIAIIYGCTDLLACNYNPSANVDDGSCDLPNGCGDPLYLEYDPLVTCSNTSACITLIVNGCMDVTACNYNSSANVDDGSCDLPNGCGDPLYLEYDPLVTCSNTSACITLIVNGCMDVTACNYNSSANVDDGSCLTLYGCMNTSAINYDSLANCSDSCIFPQVTYGCTDSTALNYNPLAIIDDSSCIYCVYGCTDSLACNYDSFATCDDGSCLMVYGCTNPLACNYDSTAQCDNGSCLTIYGCTDSLACNYDSFATCDNGSCLTVYGCTNPLACNYDSTAQCDDGSCLTLYGCTNPQACNYDSIAQCDDGSCLIVYGCTDLLAYNFDSLATCNDSSCVYEYNVTFQLDLRGQTSISYTTPELNGSFNGWCGNCAQMTDSNNDSIWEITVPILEGPGPVSGVPGWEYKFSADNWNIQENLFSGDSCTFSAFGYTNRYINVTQDTILDPVCWESCVDCFGPQSSYNVTFQLDMTNVSGFSVPEVNGEFNGWCGNCWSMTDIDGDNIWEFTTLLDTSYQEYKFSADNWNIQEQLDSSSACVYTTFDSLGNIFVNRYLNIYSDTIIDVVCWEECDSCSSINLLINLDNEDISIYPNPTQGLFHVVTGEKIDKIIIYNLLGNKVIQINEPDLQTEIDLTDKQSNIYYVEILRNNEVIRKKVINIQ